MRQATMRWLSVTTLVLGGCGEDTGNFTPDPSEVKENHRPSVNLDPLSTFSGEIPITFVATDEDLDSLSVTLSFSTDEGASFQRCTAAIGSTNPLEGLAGTGDSGEFFVWDSATDLPDDAYSIQIRAVPHDGFQAGDAVVKGPFDVDNTQSGGSGEEPSNLGDVGGLDEISFNGGGEAEVTLSTGGDNRQEQFLMVLVNGSDSAAGFSLATASSGARTAETSTQAGAVQKRSLLTPKQQGLTPFRQTLRTWADQQKQLHARTSERVEAQAQVSVAACSSLTPSETSPVLQDFRVIADLDTEGVYQTVTAKLSAVGDAVEIWVDRDVPLGWVANPELNCSPVEPDVPEDSAGRDTYGFTNCDLQTVTTSIDDNILNHLHDLYGDESDVDGNSCISVLITPVLNQLTITNASEEDDDVLLPAYADPEVDLTKYSGSSNPGSNYREMIYLAAPDPAGFFNPLTGGGGEEAVNQYVTVQLGANIASSLSKLISYNMRRIEPEDAYDSQDDWLEDGLGMLAADLTGFGSVVYGDVARFLDAPHLYSLNQSAGTDVVSKTGRGFQYLLCRYFVDVYGEELLKELISNPSTGTAGIEAVLISLDPEADPAPTFEDFFLKFAVALATTGLKNPADGTTLVSDVEEFKDATTISLSDTEYVGAQGFQQGISLRGQNHIRTVVDGTVKEVGVITLNGADYSHFAAGIKYYGNLAGSYGLLPIHVAGLLDDQTKLEIAAGGQGDGGGDFLGAIVRLPDFKPENPPVVIEQVFGALATDHIRMSAFPDGQESVGLGTIDDSQTVVLLSGTEEEVADTDIYELDLSDATVWKDKSVTLVIEATRSMEDTSGTIGVSNIVLAVAPLGDIPEPTELGVDASGESVNQSSYACDGKPVKVSYPSAYLDYLFYQRVLIPSESQKDGYDPVGTASEDPTTCNFDLGLEKSLGTLQQNDVNEPIPANMADQILTRQTQQLGKKSTVEGFYPYSTKFIDLESIDVDSDPYFDYEQGYGGRFTGTGEEAHLLITLPVGQPAHQYGIIVAGVESFGPYELTVRVLPEL